MTAIRDIVSETMRGRLHRSTLDSAQVTGNMEGRRPNFAIAAARRPLERFGRTTPHSLCR
jgi:hypothetical protein